MDRENVAVRLDQRSVFMPDLCFFTNEQVRELKQVIRDLIEKGELDDLEFTEANDTTEFKTILNRAKILSMQ